MPAFTFLHACLVLLAAVRSDKECGSRPITCDAGLYSLGDPASVACNLHANVTACKLGVSIVYYPTDAPVNDPGKEIVSCRWEEAKKDHVCRIDKGYNFDDNDDHPVLGIPYVNRSTAGFYMCYVMPPKDTQPHVCKLTCEVRPPTTSLSPGPEGKPSSDHHRLIAAVVIMAVLLVLILLFFLAASILCKDRLKRMIAEWRNRQQRCNDVERSATQQLISANAANDNSTTLETTAQADENIEGVVRGLRLEASDYRRMLTLFEREMDEDKLPLTAVTATSRRSESGNRMAGVIGGSTLKIVRVKQQGQNIESRVTDYHKITAPVRQGTDVQICDLRLTLVVNDATDMLVSAAAENPNCKIAIVLKDGINTCYSQNEKNVYTTAEFGPCADGGCLDLYRTEFDFELDRNSLHPQRHVLEKMTSLMHLGELVRLVLVKLTDNKRLFTSVSPESALYKPQSFKTDLISLVDRDKNGDFKNTELVLRLLEVDGYSNEDCKIVQYVCRLISERAAYLAATVLAVLVRRLGQTEITVVVDEFLDRYHPRIYQLMVAKTRELVGEKKFNIKTFPNESGKGAAILSATT